MRLWHQQHFNTKLKFQRGSEIPNNRNLWALHGQSCSQPCHTYSQPWPGISLKWEIFPLWIVTALVQKRLHSLAYVSPLNFTELFRAQKSQQVTIQEAGGISKLCLKTPLREKIHGSFPVVTFTVENVCLTLWHTVAGTLVYIGAPPWYVIKLKSRQME